MNDKEPVVSDNGVTIVPTGTCHDCGGRCLLKAHVKNGKIIRLETDNGEEPQVRACLRGRAYRQRVYHPDRLKYPLKRVGERGEGKFERISWDEALDTVASEMRRIKETYGNQALCFFGGSGSQSFLHSPASAGQLLAYFGGFSRSWSGPSYEGPLFASMATYGTISSGNSREDLLNSKFIILWAFNPADTIQDPGTSYILAQCKEKGIRMVYIDPRFTDTGAAYADQWIPIRPGTDCAMLIAMAYVIITENLHDQAFIDKYTVGFDKYKAYVLGEEDGIPKTPQWAEEITKVPADVIVNLAREYATTKPSVLLAGWGPARAAMGEQYSRAANVLTAITGNIGMPGGYAAGFMRAYYSRSKGQRQEHRAPGNAVEEGFPLRKDTLYKLRGGTNPSSARFHGCKFADAVLQGKAGGYPFDIKMIYVSASNLLNQYPNVNHTIEALKSDSLEFIVVQEQFMTPTAKFGDILLPAATFFERSDITPPWMGSPYYILCNKAIEPLYESKTDLEIFQELGKRLGIEAPLIHGSEEELLHEIAMARGDLDNYEEVKQEGVAKIKLDEPIIGFKKQIEDPQNNPFATPSGKIEIYSEHIAEMNNPMIPPIPKYISPRENYDDPLAEKYPLQLLSPHSNKTSAHSSMENIPWLDEVQIRRVWISIQDAEDRGIRDGDLVDVFNDRGRVRIPAYVTKRIIPGVVCIFEGGWYTPDENGIDRGGCPNVLVKDDHSPGGAWPCNTSLVQVELAQQG